MQNLYEVITNLVARRVDLEKRVKELFPNAKNGNLEERALYGRALSELKKVKIQIEDIEKKYAIGVVEMAKIISDATGKHYVPKIFGEVAQRSGKTACTNSFVACYINEKSVYYFDPYHEILLKEEQYNKLLDDIDSRNGVIQFSGSELFEDEQLNPRGIYENTNFIKMFTQPKVHTEVNKVFEKRVKPLVISHLQSIEVDCVDENLSQAR